MTTPDAQTDPVRDELALHGIRGEFLDGRSRDKMRELGEDCERCRDVTITIDRVLMAAFIGGTGPFG